MEQIYRFFYFQFENLMTMFLGCLVLWMFFIHKWWKKMDKAASELEQEDNDASYYQHMGRCAMLITVMLPVTMLFLLALPFFVQDMRNICLIVGILYILLSGIFASVYGINKGSWFILFSSDIRISIIQMITAVPVIWSMTMFYTLTVKLQSPSVIIPLICRFMCVWSLISLYQRWRSDRNEAYYIVSPLPGMISLCTHVLQSLILWGMGGFYSTAYAARAWIDAADWIRGVLRYSDGFYGTAVRISGIIHVILLLIPFIGIARRYMAETLRRSDKLKLIVPPVLAVLSLFGLWLGTAAETPPYKGLHGPIIPEEEFTSYLRCIGEDTIPVLQNGANLHLDSSVFIDGTEIDIHLEVLDDYSDHPYLRFYAKPYGNGAISVWVENRGGKAAENCSFRLSDQDRVLAEFYPEDLLQTGVDMLAPGANIRLFILKSEDMIRIEYARVPLILEVESEFISSGQHQKLTAELIDDIFISMIGLNVEECYSIPYTDGVYLEEGMSLNWEQYLYEGDTIIEDFQCSQTVLVEVQIDVEHRSGGVTHLEPFRFVYEK